MNTTNVNLPLRLEGRDVAPVPGGQLISAYDVIEWLEVLKEQVENKEFVSVLALIDDMINHLDKSWRVTG